MAGDPESTPDAAGAKVSLAWVGIDDLPILLSNQFVAQHHDDQFVVTMGQFYPPPILGTPDEIADQVSELSFLPVRPLGRFSMDEKRLRELIEVLTRTLDLHQDSKRTEP